MQLSEYLSKHQISHGEFAEKIGVHRSSVVRFCARTRRPDLTTTQKIHEATDGAVRAEDFYEAREAS